ncbi:MAG TPA: RNA polymerase sigma factor [Phycisphaerae bacterium]|nr:RNA polymerase sigma factor [Phycisphaerae bacterium]
MRPAIRQVRDPGMAEDIVQGVFMALATKAPSLRAKAAILPAWLLVVTRYAARSALRRRAVRTRHEQKVAIMETASPPTVDSEKLSSMLDEALSRLSSNDRTAIALYYFENHSMRDVGNALAVSEDAAQMRVSRALVRLRKILQHMGIACPTDAFEESMHRCGAVTPPAALLAAVTSSILHPATASSGGSLVAQHLLKGLFMKKVTILAITATITTAVIAAPTVPLVYRSFSSSANGAPPVTLIVQNTHSAAPAAAPAPGAVSVPADSTFSITLPNGISIELLGLMDDSTHQAWAPDGSPLQNPLPMTGEGYVNLNTNPNVIQRGIIWSARLKLPSKLDIVFSGSLNVGNGGATSEESDQNGTMITQLTPVSQSKKTGTIHFDMATGPWQTIVASDGNRAVEGGVNGGGNLTLQPTVNDKNNLSITLIQKNIQPNFYTDYTYRLVARTDTGKEIYPNGSTGNNDQITYTFNNISLDQIETIEFQIRPFDLFVEFQNVSLVPGKHTNVQIDSWQNIN